MKSPYVCAVCGQEVMIGRHKSGWRHCAEGHSDHPVKRVKRTDYEKSDEKEGYTSQPENFADAKEGGGKF